MKTDVKKKSGKKIVQAEAVTPGGVSDFLKPLIHGIRSVDGPVWALALAVIVSVILMSRPHWTSLDIPFGDGRWYAQQAITLHGFLHSGQWSEFWNLLTSPSTVTLVPTYLLFFLMPSALATGVVYGLINCVVWQVLLAVALYGLFQLVGRPVLAVPVFLLTVGNNFALDSTYYYYLDLPFMAMCLMALYLLARACLLPGWKADLVAGMGVGLIFFTKPGGAFIFIGLYCMAWLLWRLTLLWDRSRPALGAWLVDTLRHGGVWLAGFIPLLMAGLYYLNGAQRIVQQWVDNQQGTYYAIPLGVDGVLRLLYYPLCLSFFYSFLLFMVLIGGLVLWSVLRSKKDAGLLLSDPARRWLIILAVIFLAVWGLVFSFGMTYKPIRSILLMLPILWIAIFTLTPLRRLPAIGLMIAATLCFVLIHWQFAAGFWPDKVNRLAEGYPLTGDWWSRMPAQQADAAAGVRVTETLRNFVEQGGVQTGTVVVGTEMLYWNSCSLNWLTQLEDLRTGLVPRLTFKTACDNKGAPIRTAFEDVSALLLILHPGVQYSQGVYTFNVKTAQYAVQHWQPVGLAKVLSLGGGAGQPPAAVLVTFPKPLTSEGWTTFMRTQFPDGYSNFFEVDENFAKRRSLFELWRLLHMKSEKTVVSPRQS